jgi:hypothetical protein
MAAGSAAKVRGQEHMPPASWQGPEVMLAPTNLIRSTYIAPTSAHATVAPPETTQGLGTVTFPAPVVDKPSVNERSAEKLHVIWFFTAPSSKVSPWQIEPEMRAGGAHAALVRQVPTMSPPHAAKSEQAAAVAPAPPVLPSTGTSAAPPHPVITSAPHSVAAATPLVPQ